MTDKPDRRHLRGFASMTPERRREIAALGGASVKPEDRGFAQHPDLASTAGRKGGIISRRPKVDADD